MKDISKEVLAKIKDGHMAPASRFKLQWKSYAFWILMGVMIVIGALSASLAVFNMIDFDPRFLHHLQLHKFFRVVVFTAPYLWVGLSLSALFFGVLAFRKTSRGYRKSLLFVTSLVVLIISILGVIGHMAKINKMMDGVIRQNAPKGFREISGPREGRWIRPGDGLIGGEILSLQNGEFLLLSFRDEKWRIILSEKTEIIAGENIAKGEKVGVIGEKIDDFVMRAWEVRRFPDDWSTPSVRMEGGDSDEGATARVFSGGEEGCCGEKEQDE